MADWTTILPEQQRKEVAAALGRLNAYDGVYQGLSQDAEDEKANELLDSLEGQTFGNTSGSFRRSHAGRRRTEHGASLVKLLEETDTSGKGVLGYTMDSIVRDSINYATTVSDPSKPDDERMATETKYILGLLSAVPVPSKENMSKPSIAAIGKPLADYRKLDAALQSQDYGTILEALKADVPKKDNATRLHLDRMAGQDPRLILTEGAKRRGAKLEEVTKAIAVRDATGAVIGPYDTSVVREYLIKGLEAAKPDEKASVYAAFLNAASKGLKNAGYKA